MTDPAATTPPPATPTATTPANDAPTAPAATTANGTNAGSNTTPPQNVIPPAVHATAAPVNPFSVPAAKKAYTAGVGGLVAAEGALLATGHVQANTTGIAEIIAAGIAGFVLAFFGAWVPVNKVA